MFNNLSTGKKILFVILGLLLIGVIYFIAERFFLPEQSVQVNEQMPGAEKNITKNKTEEDQNNKKTKTTTKLQKERTAEEENNEKTKNKEDSPKTKELRLGSFVGKTGHTVEGNVKILNVNGKNYLRFENYNQTQGPDVFVYLTPSKTPTEESEINNGVKIPIDGGPDGGEIVKEGNFNQKLPKDINLDKYNGVAIWCDAFSVPFGYASLN